MIDRAKGGRGKAHDKRTFVVVGSFTRDTPYFQCARGKGITDSPSTRQAADDPALRKGGVDNPTYLTVHEGNRCVYANSEVFGWNEGTVSAYRLDPRNGSLSYINKQPALGSILAHNSLDRTGRFVFVANYSVYARTRRQPAGSVGGRHADPRGRRTRPCPCAAVPIRAAVPTLPGWRGRTPIASSRVQTTATFSSPILGSTSLSSIVSMRRMTPSRRRRVLYDEGGAGPRHFAFHPSARYVYAINELNSTIAALAFDAASGELTLLQTVSALPSDTSRKATAQACSSRRMGAISTDRTVGMTARRLRRGRNDRKIGRLSSISSCLGKTPHDFAIDPSGRFLLVANQNSDAMIVFRI